MNSIKYYNNGALKEEMIHLPKFDVKPSEYFLATSKDFGNMIDLHYRSYINTLFNHIKTEINCADNNSNIVKISFYKNGNLKSISYTAKYTNLFKHKIGHLIEHDEDGNKIFEEYYFDKLSNLGKFKLNSESKIIPDTNNPSYIEYHPDGGKKSLEMYCNNLNGNNSYTLVRYNEEGNIY